MAHVQITMPRLGLGTWRMGERPRSRGAEIAALRLGIELGMTLIDTAEMYGEGGAEEVVGEAIAGKRDAVFLVSKIYPQNATRRGTATACERSLRRLGTDRLDFYLLHWRGSTPLADVVEQFEALVQAGKIVHWGVSNFDVEDMDDLHAAGGTRVGANQVLYNLARREADWALLSWCRRHRVPVMAYTPLGGALLKHRAVRAVAERHRVAPAAVALAWVLEQRGVVTIPKAASVTHVRENRAALDVTLTVGDREELERAFPAPDGPVALRSA
jgi:diketogulonate reductase-like aldo/keto reductase